MRQIVKQDEPVAFSEWREQDHMAHRPKWKRVPANVKQAIQESLMEEQGFICSYCESSIVLNESHVEHFRPIRRYQDRQLDYENMHCSCQRQLRRGESRHCGFKKGSWFSEGLLISPLEADCGRNFLFTGNGEIFARNSNDPRSRTTIKKLGLNLPKLQALRSAAIDALRDLSSEEVLQLLQRRHDGRYVSFNTAIGQVLVGG